MNSLLIFVIQLYVFSFLAILLHYLTPRIGLAPLLFMLAGIIGLMNVIELNGLVIFLADGIILRPGGHIFVPVSLLIILMLYVVHGTRPARIAVIGIIGVNVLVFATLTSLSAYVAFPSDGTEIVGLLTDSTAFNFLFIRGMLASLIAFIADMMILVILYQGMNNHFSWIPKLIIPGIALMIALWIDSVIYNIGAFLGTANFSFTIPSDILVKTLASLLLTPLVGWYLIHIAPVFPEYIGPDKRRTLSILFRSQASMGQLETLETELRISRSIYNQLTQHIEEVFWLIDVEKQRFIYVSPAYERITKHSVEPLYDNINHLANILYHEEHEYTEDDILRFLTTERNTEFKIKNADQTILWLRARAFPIRDEQGNIIRYAGIAEDITEHKEASQQKFELALAQERMKVLHDFIRDASHDLKTPISAMVLKIGLLERIEDEARRREIRKELRGRAIYLSELITDLFTLSRIEGHEQIDMSNIELNHIIEGVIQDTKALANNKGLAFYVELSSDETDLIGNYEQISRVVGNLISNAIRYTTEGNIWLKSWQENQHVYLSVRDTGIGIAEDKLDHIFGRFFRTDEAKETDDGTGLGLAICKAIIDKHHGVISVDSAKNEGTTFILKIPQSQPANVSEMDTRRSIQEIQSIAADI